MTNEGYLIMNPMSLIKPMKEPIRLRNPLTNEEIERLRQACTTIREECIIEFMISTGCRLSEIVQVNKEDIDWNDLSLSAIGKGNKERLVYCNTKCKILFGKYFASRTDDDPSLFVASKFPYKRIGGRAVEQWFHNIANRAGFTKSIFPHLLRHSYATQKIRAGMPVQVLQSLLGHSNIDTTMGYVKMNTESVKYQYMRTMQ